MKLSSENKKAKKEIDISIIAEEIETAKQEERDFNISHQSKKLLCEKYTTQKIVEHVLSEIRRTNTSVIDQPPLLKGGVGGGGEGSDRMHISNLIKRVVKESEILGAKNFDWMYKINDKKILLKKEDTILLSCSTTSGMLSTYLSGFERYSQKMSKNTPSVVENWNNDALLKKVITNNLGNPNNEKEALSRNRLRVGCMQTFGCKYPTPFPISVVLWILKREAKLRPTGKLERFIDPCAGWGDRLAGALIAGASIVENYVGIDPWSVSAQVCRRVMSTIESDVCVEIHQTTAQDNNMQWPDCDLCFTSPPYAKLECYNIENTSSIDDGQAWRLCDSDRFISDFLKPLLTKASDATRKLDGRIIINIGNTPKSAKGENLTEDTIKAAEEIGLELCETFGMRLSVRAPKSTFDHGSEILRGEPFFVFKHKK